MKRYLGIILIMLAGFGSPALADDACDTGAIHTLADVSVSDGLAYQVESFYRSPQRVAARFIRENGSLHVVEGPNVWVRAQGNAQLAGGFQRDFALGHQFHAFFLNFANLVDNLQKVDQLEFAGGRHSAWEGTRATGGLVYLIDGQDPNRPFGLRYDVGDLKIEITPSDWRDLDGTQVPYALSINDGERVFEYRYQSVDLSDKPFTWFYDQIKSPGIDAVDIERLHRNLLIAHCMGDADGMEALTAPNAVVVSGGSVFDIAKGDTARQFTNVFSRRQYSAYIDTALPRIQVDGDVGWAAVQVNAKGMRPANGELFDEHWGWVMMARKIDGQWLMAGNASNLRPKGE